MGNEQYEIWPSINQLPTTERQRLKCYDSMKSEDFDLLTL